MGSIIPRFQSPFLTLRPFYCMERGRKPGQRLDGGGVQVVEEAEWSCVRSWQVGASLVVAVQEALCC